MASNITERLEQIVTQFGINSQAAEQLYGLGYGVGLLEGSNRFGGKGGGTRERTVSAMRSLAGLETYRKAYQNGHRNLTTWLETLDPTEPSDRLDAYQRSLYAMGIRQSSSRYHGVAASTLQELYDAEGGRGATMVPELFRRAWTFGATYGVAGLKAMRAAREARFYNTSGVVSEIMEPGFFDQAIHDQYRLRPSILSDMVAIETGIDGDVFKAFYADDTTGSDGQVRIAEGALIPTVRITGSDQAVNLQKYGRAIEMTYEVTRRWRLDLVAFHVAKIAARAQLNKEYSAFIVARDGDGNGNAAPVTNISTLTGGVANTLALKPLTHFGQLFRPPLYRPTIGFGTTETVVEYLNMNMGSGISLMAFLGQQAVLNGQGGMADSIQFPVAYARDDYATTRHFLWLDGDQTIGRIFEIGSDLKETDRIIERQLEVVTMSEVEGFWKIDKYGARVLAWNA